MQRILRFQKMLANALGWMVIILMFIIVIEVVGRFLFNTPLKGGIEISQIVMTWILFLPLAYALVRGDHVRVTMVVMRLPPRLNLIVEVLGTIVSLAFVGLTTYVGWLQFCDSFSIGETLPAPIWLPFWLEKLALPLGFFLFFVQLCVDLVERVMKSRSLENGY
jgi:TRAP-type mannitol/chloroaromatic compound transport system permease small subunit